MTDRVRLAWHYVALEAPAAWEVVGYKNDPADARLVLADRRGETLHVYARPVREKPLVTQRLVDLVDEACRTGMTAKEVRRQIVDLRGWRAFLPEDVSLPVFAGRYVADGAVLVNLTFPPHPDTRDRRCVEAVLASFEPNGGPVREWALFGLRVRLPEEMGLRDVSPLPAAQVLRFENGRGESVTVHRYGMMPLVLAGEDMATFFARVKGRGSLLRREGAFLKDNRYEGVKLSYTTRGRGGFDSLLARTWQGRVWIWRRDDVRRLCCVDHHAMEQNVMEDLVDEVDCR